MSFIQHTQKGEPSYDGNSLIIEGMRKQIIAQKSWYFIGVEKWLT